MLIGLAVGVDYAMFYLRRMMEERDTRPLGRGRARGRRRHLGPRGADLRLDRAWPRWPGMFFAGNPIFVVLRHRHDPRRRASPMLGSLTVPARRCSSFLGQKDWLEKGRVPCVAKRRHKTKGESRVWGADPRPRPQAPARLGGARRRPARRPRASPRSACSSRTRAPTACSRSQPIIQTLRPHRRRLPGRQPCRPRVVVKAKDVTTPAGPGRDPAAARPGDRHRPAVRALERRDQPGQDRRRRRARRSRATAPTPPPNRSLEVLRDEVVPATVGKLPAPRSP